MQIHVEKNRLSLLILTEQISGKRQSIIVPPPSLSWVFLHSALPFSHLLFTAPISFAQWQINNLITILSF